MKELFRQIDWKKYSLSIAAFMVALGILLITLFVHIDKQRQLQVAEFGFSQQRSINQEANNAQGIIKSSFTQYEDLKTSGLVGDTQRLQWIETTQALSNELGIPLIDFTLDSAEVIEELGSPYWNYELEMQSTPMALEMDLRHEGEFYKFMEGLRLNAKGIFSVDQCDLRRNALGSDTNPEYSGFQSKCKLTWYAMSDVTLDWTLGEQ